MAKGGDMHDLIRGSFAVLAVVAAEASAQELLSDDVTAFVGAGPEAAWFEKSGTYWVTDGSARVVDSGVAIGAHGLSRGWLTVYRPTTIERIDASGATTSIPCPISYTGFDDDADHPTIWRPWLSTGKAEVIEVWQWAAGIGWQRHLSGAQVDSELLGDIVDVRVRAGRYLVTYENWGSRVADLFPAQGAREWQLSQVDPMGQPGPYCWSQGLYFKGEDHGRGPAIVCMPDRGEGVYTALPSAWGWASTEWTLRELTSGFIFADDDRDTANSAFRTRDTRQFPDPDGRWEGLLWVAPTDTLLAHSFVGGTSSVTWFDRTTDTWQPAVGFGNPIAIAGLGEFDGQSYLVLHRPSGVDLVRVDGATCTAQPVATGLRSIGSDLMTFAGGFLFAADDGVHGSELWWSDGSPTGTKMLADLELGPTDSSPRGWTLVGERAVFVTERGGSLRLWSIDPEHVEWTRSPVNGHFYRLTPPMPWSDAERRARNLGGHLATVRSSAEQDWLWETFGPANLWIGLEDRDHDGVFQWTSGEPVGFTWWCAGEPNHSTPAETVVHLADYPGFCSGGWNDQEPTDPYAAIVERRGAPLNIEPFGRGCSANPTEPAAALRHVSGAARPGSHLEFQLELGIGTSLTGAVALGFDSTEFAGMQLPIDLAPIGARGCELYVSVDDVLALGGHRFVIPWTLAIPSDPALRGAIVHAQGLGFEWAGGLTRVTNAVRITVGL